MQLPRDLKSLVSHQWSHSFNRPENGLITNHGSSFSTFARNPDTPLLPKCHWHKLSHAYCGLGKAIKASQTLKCPVPSAVGENFKRALAGS